MDEQYNEYQELYEQIEPKKRKSRLGLSDLDRKYKGLRYRIFGAIQRGEIDGFREMGRMQGVKQYTEE